jgi:hypothetical protein
MYRNVKHQLRADGPWPSLPLCTLCRPDSTARTYKFRLIGLDQIVMPQCTGGPVLPQWDGTFPANGKEECRLTTAVGLVVRQQLQTWERTLVNVLVTEHSAAAQDGWMTLQVRATCPEYGPMTVWRGRKHVGPDAAGVYQRWWDPTLQFSLGAFAPSTMSIARL